MYYFALKSQIQNQISNDKWHCFTLLSFIIASGSGRFDRLKDAAERGCVAPPVDMRYLRKGERRLDERGDQTRALIFTFIEGIYHSQAETLPDVRDDPADEVSNIIAKVSFEDEYAKALDSNAAPVVPKEKKRRKHCRSIQINLDRADLEVRYLPPGCFRDLWEQMVATGDKVSFSQFWRVWRSEFPHLKFRQHSTHSMCAVCARHKLLMKELSQHLRARQRQHELYVAHLRHQYQDRCVYWKLRSLSRAQTCEICLIIDSMDQAKFAYPRGAIYRTKDLASMQRPRSHITGIIIHGYAVVFSVSGQDQPKDSNTMIELVSAALTILQKEHKVQLNQCVLSIQSDNTCREMKNNPFLKFLAYLVSNRILSFNGPL